MSATSSRTPAQPALDQVGRLLRLVPYLNNRGSVPLDRAAADLGVSRRQLDKDLRVLFMCGLPGGYPDDLIDVDLDALEQEGVVRVSNADYLSRPLRLQATEAAALVVALRSLRTDADDETREVLDRVLAKLEVAAGGVAQLVDAGADPAAGLSETRATVRRAIDEGRQLRLTYLVPARDEESDRVVDPDTLVTEQGHDYLGAWCHRAEAPRWFRLDRISRADVLDTPVEHPDQGPRPPQAPGSGLFEPPADALRVTLRLAPEARWVPEYYQVDEVRPLPDGGLEVDLAVADERWLRRTLLRLAPAATVVRPAEFTQMFTADLASVAGLYDEHHVE
ncbi:YafY family protein [Nocardioides sp. CFH 31398]|uniref:helix-turn-helix transcriptional regulator n=1 Tax=Nocardioides sp. CFH 31398 TaxID=2919579 RepID=UPI001F0649CD|nr:WYL domain-containing protein [Nocardioides sp. CFH 31398]MCH1866863.1 WYL domain-containing protein [Nocardioides sp. CFH 31398]